MYRPWIFIVLSFTFHSTLTWKRKSLKLWSFYIWETVFGIEKKICTYCQIGAANIESMCMRPSNMGFSKLQSPQDLDVPAKEVKFQCCQLFSTKIILRKIDQFINKVTVFVRNSIPIPSIVWKCVFFDIYVIHNFSVIFLIFFEGLLFSKYYLLFRAIS